MPPKRKAAGGAKGKGAKKAKIETPDSSATMKDAAKKLKAEDKKKGGKKSHKLDSHCNILGGSVYEDYDCMLNQTNIGNNNNKYYVIQVVEHRSGRYYTWNRWGRVGESGQKALKGPTTLQNAIKAFEKKFTDKTKNNWADRANFKPVPGKYTLIEMADVDEVDAPLIPSVSAAGKKIAPSKLDPPTQFLLNLIFNEDMFKDTLKKFEIDVKKMPLGKLSKGQIAKGFEVLDEIEKDLKANKKTKLNELSSRFYTVIPHDFGRKIPPVIDNLELLRTKMDMLLVLGDIEIAQSLQKEKDKKMAGDYKRKRLENGIFQVNNPDADFFCKNHNFNDSTGYCEDLDRPSTYTEVLSAVKKLKNVNSSKTKVMVVRKSGRIIENEQFCYNGNILDIVNQFNYLGNVTHLISFESVAKTPASLPNQKAVVPNPLDINYSLLNCDLEVLDKKSPEYKIIDTYTKATSGGWNLKIHNVWKVNRDGEGSRFKTHDKMGNRKLLWHGTSVAVVAAILKSGLRIMPHSGGRLGAGIYFASENSKSACYVGRSGVYGIMFLNEVVLGHEFGVQQSQSSLRSAPSGFDSVRGQGRTEPDLNKDITLKFDGKPVTVPQGKPKNSPACTRSAFSQSEYLIYKESQNRMRYLLLIEF